MKLFVGFPTTGLMISTGLMEFLALLLNALPELLPRGWRRAFVSVCSLFCLSPPHAVTQQHEGLQVRKNLWTKKQMSDAAYVDQAAEWSKSLTQMRVRGPGDIPNAMRSVERDYGIDYWLQWRLRYRRSILKDISVSAYVRLSTAYQSECERQTRKMKHEMSITDPHYVATAEALVREIEGKD